MSTYAMTVDEVEELTNIDFFPSLPDKIETKVENEVDFSKWTVNYEELQKKYTNTNTNTNTSTTPKSEPEDTEPVLDKSLIDKAVKILDFLIDLI